MSSGLYELLTTGVEVQEIGNVPLLSINKVRLAGGEMFMKGVLDFVVSIAVLLVSWPFMLAIAIAIKLDSPGPIFYRRRLHGHDRGLAQHDSLAPGMNERAAGAEIYAEIG